MNIYNYFNNNILFFKIFDFKKYFLYYISGQINENDFKLIRLQNGLYRQKFFYMYRISIPYGNISNNQLNLFSYISKKYDKNYFHLTTRTNFQFNWIKIIDICDILLDIFFLNLHSIQTSGNCIRNITINKNYYIFEKELILSEPWGELLRQWFNFNSEFIFLPRKFKISILNSIKDNISSKIHDLSLYIKKNNFKKIIFNILIGGGLGRNPIIGKIFFKNLHWKNILNICDKILRIYNIYGYRNNIYKSRLKLLIKSINIIKFKNFIINEYKYSNKIIYNLNEKEINNIYINFNNNLLKNNINIIKNIKYNIFFLNWYKNNFKNLLNLNKNLILLPLKNNNKACGDINFIQIKLILYLSKIYNIFEFNLSNRQNFIINYIFIYNLNNLYNIIKKYFFNIYNYNLITDIITCPGLDFCSLANASSISVSNDFQNFYQIFNNYLNIKNIILNISGCINSCAHHHISNIGILGVNKKNTEWYQLYLGGNNLNFSKVLGNSFLKKNLILILNKILKIYLYKKIYNEFFIDTYNRLGFFFFKDYIFN